MALDYHRFFSDSTHDYLKLQSDILRSVGPGKAITHNEMGLFDHIDYSQLNASLDFVAWDNYPMSSRTTRTTSARAWLTTSCAARRAIRTSWSWSRKEGRRAGACSGDARRPQGCIARGLTSRWLTARTQSAYFRWRTSRYGTEQYWQGVLDQDSTPNARYQVVSQMGKELGQITKLLRGSKVVSPVALLVSPDTRWAFQIQPLVKDFDYNRQLRVFYGAFRRTGTSVDIVFPQSDLSGYKVIVAPSLLVVDSGLAQKLTDFVRGGGTLILTYRSGVKDEHNVFTDQTLPGPLRELAGVAIHDYDPQTHQEQEVVGADGSRYPARVWFDILDPFTAQTLATYGKGYYQGKAAVAQNSVGKGTVIYVGTESSDDHFYQRLATCVAQQGGVSLGAILPSGVEMAAREKPGRRIVFLLNYTENAQTVSLGKSYRNALSGAAEPAEVQIAPFDVKVLVGE